MKLWASLGILILLTLSACGKEPRDREDYGDVGSSTGGISLRTFAEHKQGYGQRECMVCHNVQNIHRRADFADVGHDINAEVVRNGGEPTYCLSCHRDNGL